MDSNYLLTTQCSLLYAGGCFILAGLNCRYTCLIYIRTLVSEAKSIKMLRRKMAGFKVL